MATPLLHVKAKGSWKSVDVPQDLLNRDDFSGLVVIQVLTDYELVSSSIVKKGSGSELKRSKKTKTKRVADDEDNSYTDLDSIKQNASGSELKKSKKTKRKRLADDEDDYDTNIDSTTQKEVRDESQLSVKPKKKKRKRETDVEEKILQFEQLDKEVQAQNSKAKKKKKSQKNTTCDQSPETGNVVSAGGGIDILSNDSLTQEPNNLQEKLNKKKKKRKKKKKKANQNAHIKDLDIDTAGEEGTAISGQKTEKKKGKKKKTKASKKNNTSSSTESIQTNQIEAADIQRIPNTDMSEWNNLFVPELLLSALRDQGFGKPTLIQRNVLPPAIRDRKDILGAAETGSGKTLAFGIPVLAKILEEIEKKDRMATQKFKEMEGSDEEDMEGVEMEGEEREQSGSEKEEKEEDTSRKKTNPNHKPCCPFDHPMALILEPTRELAVQVKKHITALASHTDIKCAIIVGGMSIEKQRRVLSMKPHVVIATPGRLWQLIEEGDEYLSGVSQVFSLVVDEADRMVEKGHFEELTKLMEILNRSEKHRKTRQTFVMSATLTMDVSVPKRLLNKSKKKVKHEDKLKTLTERICIGLKPKVIDLTPKDKVAQTLTELRVNCPADEKDLYLYYFLCEHPGRTLVFVNSKDCLRRLISVFTLLQCQPLPLHADMHQKQRLKNLDRFTENSKSLLLASDVAARGLDIPKVDHVIHYQVPRTMENYIHRSGRTARASNLGLSVMLICPEEARNYRKIVQGVRNGEDLPVLPVEVELIPAARQRIQLAKTVDVTEHRLKKKKAQNNFFLKAAEDMDMIIDDPNLLEDLGEVDEQNVEKKKLQRLKNELSGMLRGSLAPLRMSKYPTKSGQLVSKKVVNLYTAGIVDVEAT